MTELYLFDDSAAREFAPFSLTRPASELRAGALLLRERWERAFGVRASGIISDPHLADFEEFGAPPSRASAIPAGAVLANSRLAINLDCQPPDADVWECDGQIAALRLREELPASSFQNAPLELNDLCRAIPEPRVAAIPGRWLDAVWSLISTLPDQLREDIPVLASGAREVRDQVLGDHPVWVDKDAVVEPWVLFDATAGPILVRQGATVRAFTRLVGPCVIGSGSTILGDRVSGCSIGEGCMVRGEISDTIIVGNSNKGHEGFVGHSVLGRWVNLGAGTTTSNLKNTYGRVAIHTPGGLTDTGMTKLGSLIGDHAKTGIGMRLTTGTVIGAGASIAGAAMPGKYVPPFSWGQCDKPGEYDLERFLTTTERVMGRRNVVLGVRARRQLSRAHELSRGERGG
jgi:UDP-N-acetylglucosamine diphosphorylase/glucosamine-1-phosphate N-acetyltransferase